MTPLFRAAIAATALLAGSVAAQTPGWAPTGSMRIVRAGHTATLLTNGKVLVVGGGLASAELYDPATGEWNETGSPFSARFYHGLAVRLFDGTVLVAGDTQSPMEVYDPSIETWTPVGHPGFDAATATLLLDGRVLVTRWGSTLTALYDPASGSWIPAGRMNAQRVYQEAVLLPNGKVLVVGGDGAPTSAELYDVTTGTWTFTGSLGTARIWDHFVTLLPNGKVLVTGGSEDEFCAGLTTSELYDPASGQWSSTGNSLASRSDYYNYNGVVLLPNGKVLAAGGAGPGCAKRDSAELYDAITGTWSASASMLVARSGHTLTVLQDGRILAAGGDPGSTAEILDTGTPGLSTFSAASIARGGAVAPESFAVIEGLKLAADTAAAATLPLPTVLAGASVRVRDHFGVERIAPLLFVSPGQINYVIPPGTAAGGLAAVTVLRDGSILAAGVVEVAKVAPGIFTSNATGGGPAAAVVLRVRADGTTRQESVADPIDMGPSADQVFLILYGTGIQFRSELSAVSASIGGVSSEVLYAGPAPGYPGLDQINVRLPRGLAGRGIVEIALAADGVAANTVSINIR